MTRVFVLGNASIDLTLRVPRLPAPGETLIAAGVARAPGGKGLNQAVMAARAGAMVHFCAPLGIEPEAALVRHALATERMAAIRLPNVGAPTDLSTLLVADDAENCIISAGNCSAALAPAAIEVFVSEVGAGDLLLMQGNLSQATTLHAAMLARARGASIVLNAAPLRWDYAPLLPLCDLVVANRGESATLTGYDDPELAASVLRGTGSAIVTLGARGCVVATPEEVCHHPAVRSRAVDTTGAGDVFCGVLVAAIAAGRTEAVRIAQRAAALSVARPGCFTAFPTAEELGGMV